MSTGSMPSNPNGVIAGRVPPPVSDEGHRAAVHGTVTDPGRPGGSFTALLTPARRREMGRIVLVGVITLLYSAAVLPLWMLLAAVMLGLYPLVKTGVADLVHEHRLGTEIFVTFATVIALISGEYVAASVLMTIILIAEFIADFNTDRARASITALIGSVPHTALLKA